MRGEPTMTHVCPREIEVIRAVKEGLLSDELRMHAQHCETCSTTIHVGPMIKELLAETALDDRSFPSHQTLWIRAQFTSRQEKLSLLDLIAFSGAIVLGLAGLLGILLWKVPAYLRLLPGFENQSPVTWSDLVPVGIPVFVIVGGLLLYTFFSDLFAVER